ncbi:Protein of unknown function [Gryllus bimaculatus]|nr:Protein of unknown function [Gryllus bimaculatus]
MISKVNFMGKIPCHMLVLSTRYLRNANKSLKIPSKVTVFLMLIIKLICKK